MNTRLRRTMLLAAAALFVLVCCVTPSISAAFKNVQVSQPPPDLALKDLSGKEWHNADLFGKGVTVAVFWATWSPRSPEVLRDLEALRTELGPEKFQLISVNCEHISITAMDREAIAATAKTVGLTGPVLIDDGLVAFNAYGAVALPSTLVVGADGKVAFSLSGYPTTMRGDLADAIRKAAGVPTVAELRPMLEYVPKNHALMYYNLGRQLLSKGQDEKAEEQLKISVEKDPDFKKSRVELGLLFKKTGRAELALKEFQRAREIDPKDHEALYQVAAVSLAAGRLEEAEKLFRELHGEFPEREELALGLALAVKYQGRAPEYAKLREEAAKLIPADARYVYEMGGVAEKQKDTAVAAELYRRALEAGLAAKK
jgi:thioredoxin-like negative regulator of GroEL